MILLHNIGALKHPNYNTISRILGSEGPISFDGVYRNVYSHMPTLEELKGKRRIILFVMGDYVGADNTFDSKMPRERFCDWPEIVELCQFTGAELGWHTWGHPDLTKLSDDEIRMEVTPPFQMDYFAYPYGAVDSRVANIVQAAGFKEAWSVHQGDGSPMQQNRSYLK